MKYKSKQYAETLVEIMLKEKDNKKLISGFLEFVKKNRDEKKLKEILKLAESLYFKKTGHKKVILETARLQNFKNSDLVKTLLKQGDVLEEKVDSSLIAGLKIIINNEKQLDFSLFKKLQEIV